MNHCKNCGKELVGKYCYQCGQKASVKRIEMKWLLHELPHAIWHVEKGFLYNVKELFKRPGHAINDFLQGKRKNFFNPLSYLAIMILLNYLAMLFVNFHLYDNAELLSLPDDKAIKLKEDDEINWWIMEHAYWYMLIAVPITGIFIYILSNLIRKKINLAESVIVGLFLIAQFTLVQAIIYLCIGIIHNGSLNRIIEKVDMYFIFPVLIGVALFQFYSPTRNKFIIGILMLLAGESFMQLLWLSAGWMVYLHSQIF